MARCEVCDRTILAGGYKHGDRRYCSLPCYTAFDGDFCEACLSEISSEDVRSGFTVNGIGTRMRASGERCPRCHSIQAARWFVFVEIPILRLAGRYRVRWLTHTTYFGRKLRD